jgi:uncharacterized membrane protein HdeD (DUF308 family)
MTSENREIQIAGRNVKWLGIATLLLGLLVLASPLVTGISLVIMMGLLVLLGGVFRLVSALSNRGRGRAQLITGILTVICGLILVSDPILASGILSILIAVYLILDGISEMVAAWRLRPAGGWGWLMTTGTLSLLLGIMIWRQFPLSGAWALGFVLGFKLVILGLGMAGLGRAAQKAAD